MTEEDHECASTDRLAIAVDIWKHCVSVQMHFNEMEMKVRNLYITILAASLALIGVIQGKRVEIPMFEMTLSLAMLVVGAIIPISMLFYFIDRHWYHRLLHGAVQQCIDIENQYKDLLPEIQLGSKIAETSPAKFTGVWKLIFFFIKDPRFRKDSNLHSDQKIEIVYKSVICGAILIIVVYGVFDGIRINELAVFQHMTNLLC